MRLTGRIARALASGVVAAVPFLPVSASAGLFDEIGRLFGGGPGGAVTRPGLGPKMVRPARPRDSGPLLFTVGPRLKQTHPAERRARVRIVRDTAKTQPAVSLNPDVNPDWFLHDPTLRLGDIVVLKGEVLVFQGGRVPYSREDFAALGQSRLPAAEKRKVRDMAGLQADPKVAEAPAPRSVAAALQ